MRYLLLLMVIIFFSCSKKNDVVDLPTNIVDSTNIQALGVQKDIYSSTQHSYAGILESNNKRIFFALNRSSSGQDEFYTCDENDSSYKLQPTSSLNYDISTYNTSFCLKPNGEIIAIHLKVNAPPLPDSLIFYINRPHTNYWQIYKRETKNAFWNGFYGPSGRVIKILSTQSGRLVIGGMKITVSDDNGLTWRQTSTSLSLSVYSNCTTIGSRNFISHGNGFIYSDNEFETANFISLQQLNLNYVYKNIIKLDDRLVVPTEFSGSQSTFYIQSFNNGLTWSQMPTLDPIDSLSEYKPSFFWVVNGTTLRVRAKYKPCNNFYAVDIKPGDLNSRFVFYPNRPVPCVPASIHDNYINSTQRGDKRMYYVATIPIGNLLAVLKIIRYY
jgi:hypothetical protein